ncbi:MAG: nucleotidyltransferase domain-containing protein [Thermoplasmata archaeon]|nr:nucleotidyltransferase domain-containing protein [Thermoplasmata archaeon]
MIDKRFKLPIIDLIDRAYEIPNLVCIALFGSGVTGDVSKKSDIDLLMVFNCDHNPELGEEAKIARRIASELSLKHDLRHPFSFTFINLKRMEEIEPDFLWNVAKEGILIWGKPNEIIAKRPHPSLQPLMMIRYITRGMSKTDKRRLLRSLYTNKKKLIDKKEERIGPGTIVIKAEKLEKVKNLLDKFHVSYSVKKIWGH